MLIKGDWGWFSEGDLSLKYEELDPPTEEWLSRCAVGMLKESLDLSLLQVEKKPL